jgi:hypothetical protein
MVFQGLTKAEASLAFKPLLDFANASPADYGGQDSLSVADVPARLLWNGWVLRLFAGSAVTFDDRAGASWMDFWWRGDGDQVGAFWHAYASAWLPATLLEASQRSRLVDAWYVASRHWPMSLHFNKGLAGAPNSAIAAARNTPMNPDVASAFALAIAGASEPRPVAGSGRAPGAGERAARVQAAMKALRAVAPAAGAYVNECDYFQPDWQRTFWGDNYVSESRRLPLISLDEGWLRRRRFASPVATSSRAAILRAG